MSGARARTFGERRADRIAVVKEALSVLRKGNVSHYSPTARALRSELAALERTGLPVLDREFQASGRIA